MTDDNSKGFLQVNNQIIDYWMSKLTNAEFKTLLAIIRKTKGWNKPYDRISQTQIAELTGLTTRSVRTAISDLLDKNLIIVTGDDNKMKLFAVNFVVVNDVETEVTAMEKALKQAEVTSKQEEVISHQSEVTSKQAEAGFLHNKQTKDTITKDINNKQGNKKPKPRKTDFVEFDFTDKQKAKCSEYGIDINSLLEGFKDYAAANGKQYVDWSRAFNTWINNHITWNKLRPVNQSQLGGNNSAKQSKLAELEEYINSYGTEQEIRHVN